MNKIITIVIVIVALAFGLAFGYVYGLKNSNSRYEAQLEKAKKFFPPIPEMRSISGTIKKISGDVITVETAASANPFEDLPTTREVMVTDKTKIVRNEFKDPKVYQEEFAAYQKELDKAQRQSVPASTTTIPTAPVAAANFPTPPQPFLEKELKFSDLKEEDMISVEASENIKTQIRFEATRIVVVEAPVALPAGALPAAPVHSPIEVELP